MACILVDVDGTLLTGPSSEAAFIAFLARRGQLGPRQLGAAGWFYLRWWRRFGRHVAKKNKAYLTAKKRDTIEALGQIFVEEVLASRLYTPMLERLAQHTAQGKPVALLTGTPDFIAAPLARQVGAQAWRAARCACVHNRFVAAPPLSHPFGLAKVDEARALCEAFDERLDQAVAYADSGHDLPLLRQVGTPVAVRPDATLRQAALEGGWEILEAPLASRPNPAE